MYDLLSAAARAREPFPSIMLAYAPVQGRPGHAQVTGDLGGRLAGVDQAAGVLDLAVGEPFPAPAQVPARGPAPGYGIGDPFALDLQFRRVDAAGIRHNWIIGEPRNAAIRRPDE